MSRHSRSDRREILLLRKRFDLGSFRGSRVRYERGVCRTCRETSTASSAALPHVPPPGEEGACTLTLDKPPAQYPRLAFWAEGRSGGGGSAARFLLFPLSEIVDETYTVYWET